MDNADAHPGAIPGKNEVTREGVVVVIDDDASIRAALKELFESVGLKVKLYASGSAFLEDPIPNATSCLVLDMRLPEMSGLNVQEELARADGRFRHRPWGHPDGRARDESRAT
jgi:CheY-like chemotaxis protein